MSQYADIIDVVKKSISNYGLSENQAIELLIDIMGSLEWELDDVNYEGEDWDKEEFIAAKEALEL